MGYQPISHLVVTPWKKWFAWRPARVKGEWVWFQTVYRREVGGIFSRYNQWEYGTIFDILQNIEETGQRPPKPPPGRILKY